MTANEMNPKQAERMNPLLEQFGKIPEEKRSGMGWVYWLIAHHENSTDNVPWEKFNGKEWCHLLQNRPEFAIRCEWKKLNGGDWCSLLRKQPQLAEHCAWETLSSWDWSMLLRDLPQFADHCPWMKLTGRDWLMLLQCQPQFTKFCPWKNMSDEDKWKLSLISPEFMSLRIREMHDSIMKKPRKKISFSIGKSGIRFDFHGKKKTLRIEAVFE